MNNVQLSVAPALYEASQLTANGKNIKLEKGTGGYYNGVISTDGDVEIRLLREHELMSPSWFLWSMLFFVISVFGIFDVRSRYMPMDCLIRLQVDTDCSLKIANVVNQAGGIKLIPDMCNAEIVQNENYAPIIRKRRKILRWTKFACWVGLIILTIVIIILAIN